MLLLVSYNFTEWCVVTCVLKAHMLLKRDGNTTNSYVNVSHLLRNPCLHRKIGVIDFSYSVGRFQFNTEIQFAANSFWNNNLAVHHQLDLICTMVWQTEGSCMVSLCMIVEQTRILRRKNSFHWVGWWYIWKSYKCPCLMWCILFH